MRMYELWFITVNITNESKLELLKKYNNEENIYNNIDRVENSFILKGSEFSKIKETPLSRGEALLNYLHTKGIYYVTIKSKSYPTKLHFIQNPPYVLFYQGDLELVNYDMVAIVGSRKSTMYGNEVTKNIARELTYMDIGVVSGVAYGIDTMAHKEVLMNKGKTIGVLGCGIDVIYPKVNKLLYEQITNNGLLISEFIPGTRPLQYNFPMRNRIISGLSDKVIVVEASMKSGSLITVGYALEQNKDVMAVPGSVLNDTSKGCNRLLRDGAIPFTEIDDLYTFLNRVKKDKKNLENNSLKIHLIDLISAEPIHLDKILSNVNVDRTTLFELLFEMQNRNEIICLPGNYYAKLS